MADAADANRASEGKDVWNAWAAENPGAEVDFSGHPAVNNFTGFVFPGSAYFESVNPRAAMSFNGARFLGEAWFRGAKFNLVDFAHATFEARANFDLAEFQGSNVFLHAKFLDRANFQRAKLAQDNSSFSLDHAEFHDDANFEGFEFLSGTSFKNAKFYGLATFDNAKMQARTVFTDCTFGSAPTFHEAQLHQDTTFENVTWPKRIHKKQSPYDAARAWARLRVEMSRLHKYEDELFFFAKELEARAHDKRNERWPKRLLYCIYLALGAGRSVATPLVWLAGLNFFLFPIYWRATAAIQGRKASLWDILCDTAILNIPADVVSFTLGNALPFIGGFTPERPDLYQRLFARAGSQEIDVPLWLEIVAISHQLASVVLLFMIGLALRNRFRMK